MQPTNINIKMINEDNSLRTLYWDATSYKLKASATLPDDCGREAVFEKTEYRSEPTGRRMTLKHSASRLGRKQYLIVDTAAGYDGVQRMRFSLSVSIQTQLRIVGQGEVYCLGVYVHR